MNAPRVLVITGVENTSPYAINPWRHLKGMAPEIIHVRFPEYCHNGKKLLPAVIKTAAVLPRINTFDVVISSSVANGILLAVLQRVLGRRLIRPLHLMIDAGFTSIMYDASGVILKAVRWLFAPVSALICLARSSAEFWKQRVVFPNRCYFVPLAAGNGYFGPSTGSEAYVVSAGRAGRDYGILLKALEGISQDLVIIGDAQNRALIKEQLIDRPNVRYLEEIPFKMYKEMLEKAKFVVLPLKKTDYHTGQTVLIEAMALGKAVIVTRANGTEEYVRDGVDGIFVEEGDVSGLRQKIQYLLSHREEMDAMGKRARERAVQEYSEEAFGRRITDIVREIYEEKSKDHKTVAP